MKPGASAEEHQPKERAVGQEIMMVGMSALQVEKHHIDIWQNRAHQKSPPFRSVHRPLSTVLHEGGGENTDGQMGNEHALSSARIRI